MKRKKLMPVEEAADEPVTNIGRRTKNIQRALRRYNKKPTLVVKAWRLNTSVCYLGGMGLVYELRS